MTKKHQAKIKDLLSVFKRINPQRIILFGSLSSGKAKTDSDIDLCVITETKDQLDTKRQLKKLMWDYSIGFEPEVDIHVYPPRIYDNLQKRKDPFIQEISKGKILYEKR